jgi:hypothetical protein
MAGVALPDNGEFLPNSAVGNLCWQNVIVAATLLTLCNTYFADKDNKGFGLILSKVSVWDFFLALSAGEMLDSIENSCYFINSSKSFIYFYSMLHVQGLSGCCFSLYMELRTSSLSRKHKRISQNRKKFRPQSTRARIQPMTIWRKMMLRFL